MDADDVATVRENFGMGDSPEETLTATAANADTFAKDEKLGDDAVINATGVDIDVSKKDGEKEVHLFDGKQTVKFNSKVGGNMAVVESEAKGAKTITLGDNGDVVVVNADSSRAKVSITGGKGDDSIVVSDAAPVVFDMSKGGEDKLFLSSDSSEENVTLKGYKASLGGGIQTGATIDKNTDGGNEIANAIVSSNGDDPAITFGNGAIQIGGANVTFADGTTNGGTVFNLFDREGEKQAVGFTNKDGGTVNVSTSSDDYALVGNWNHKNTERRQ